MQKNTNLNSKILTLAESIVPDIIYRSKLTGIKEVPNWESHLEYDFSKDIPVSHDSYYIDFGSRNTGKFMHIMQELYPDYNIIDSGHYYYPKTGYMGWHTNSNNLVNEFTLYIVMVSHSLDTNKEMTLLQTMTT